MKENPNPTEKEPFNWKAELISWIQVLVIAALIAFVLNRFIIANSRVPSASMENTIMTHDRVIGSRLTYYFSDPQRGDVAIFYFPDDVTEKLTLSSGSSACLGIPLTSGTAMCT